MRSRLQNLGIFASAVVLVASLSVVSGHAADNPQTLTGQVSDAIQTGSTLALAGVAFIAVGREGIETALFLFAATKDSGTTVTEIGGALGLLSAAALGVLFYRGAIAINLRKFFSVTGMLVIVLAAYLLFSGMHEFGEVGGGEALEMLAPALGLLYGSVFAWLFLRAARESEERQGLLDLAAARGVALDEARASRAVAAGRGERLRRRILGVRPGG